MTLLQEDLRKARKAKEESPDELTPHQQDLIFWAALPESLPELNARMPPLLPAEPGVQIARATIGPALTAPNPDQATAAVAATAETHGDEEGCATEDSSGDEEEDEEEGEEHGNAAKDKVPALSRKNRWKIKLQNQVQDLQALNVALQEENQQLKDQQDKQKEWRVSGQTLLRPSAYLPFPTPSFSSRCTCIVCVSSFTSLLLL